jgi:hypothetical protein
MSRSLFKKPPTSSSASAMSRSIDEVLNVAGSIAGVPTIPDSSTSSRRGTTTAHVNLGH